MKWARLLHAFCCNASAARRLFPTSCPSIPNWRSASQPVRPTPAAAAENGPEAHHDLGRKEIRQSHDGGVASGLRAYRSVARRGRSAASLAVFRLPLARYPLGVALDVLL